MLIPHKPNPLPNNHTFIDGLTENTEADLACAEATQRRSHPLSQIWQNRDDTAKVIQYDSTLEQWLQRRSAILDYEGSDRTLPWDIYRTGNVDFINGYSYAQGSGDCASFGFGNAQRASDLVNCYLKEDYSGLIEKYYPGTYSIARGNGAHPVFGSGCNISTLGAYVSRTGNFWAKDLGGYDVGRSTQRGFPTEAQRAHALSTQTILIPLPAADFDAVYSLVSGGIGVVMGTARYPTSGRVGDHGLVVPRTWKNGGHAMCFVASLVRSGMEWLYLLNSHGNRRYSNESSGLNFGAGLWINRSDFAILAKTGFRYGTWYGVIGELPVR